MILFEYIPSENWLNYYDEKYRLEFGIDRSSSIKQEQLQIKNSDQQAFVDLKIDGDFFPVRCHRWHAEMHGKIFGRFVLLFLQMKIILQEKKGLYR